MSTQTDMVFCKRDLRKGTERANLRSHPVGAVYAFSPNVAAIEVPIPAKAFHSELELDGLSLSSSASASETNKDVTNSNTSANEMRFMPISFSECDKVFTIVGEDSGRQCPSQEQFY